MPNWPDVIRRYSDRVYYDDTLGIAGTLWPVGTALTPCSSLANIRTICVRENLRKIVVRGTLTLDAGMDGYEFISAGDVENNNVVALNGQTIVGAIFRDIQVQGAKGAGGGASFYNCELVGITNFGGDAWDCICDTLTFGTISSLLINCRASGSAGGALTGAGVSQTTILILGWIGTLSLGGLTHALSVVNIFAQATSPVTLLATCTLGTINLYGEMRLTNNSAGSTVNTYTLTADIDTLLARLTAARAGYLDELAAANLPADIDTLLARLTALRAGYLDELAAANLPADIDTLLARLTAARAGYLDELAAANIPADIDTLLARLTALRAGYLDELDFDLTARLGIPAGASLAADLLTIDNLVDDLEGRLTAARAGYMDFMPRVLAVSVTAAANAGVTTVATVATQPVIIDSIVLHADAAQTANLTSAAIQGGVGQVVTFILAADATQANLNAADKQLWWKGAVRLDVGKTIIVNLVGTGAAAVDLTITITYHAEVAGGVLS